MFGCSHFLCVKQEDIHPWIFCFRRERKRKFDLKEVLNLRPSSAASSVTSAPASPAAASSTTTPVTSSKKHHHPDESATTPSSAKSNNKDDSVKKRLSRRSDRQTSKTEEDDEKKSVKSSSNKTLSSSSTNNDVSQHEKDDSAAGEVVSGKRERKRKKFWDEQEAAAGASKTIKQKQPPQHHQHQPKNDAVTPVKNRRRQSLAGAESVNNSSHKDNHKVKVSDSSAATQHSDSSQPRENGKTLKYLMFDLSLDPKLIAEKMVEGENIPGPGLPIPIDSSRLPNGWEKRVIQRGIGITKGKWDVFIQSANGRSFRFEPSIPPANEITEY